MRTGIKLVVSSLMLVSAAYNIYANFHPWRFPFDYSIADRHTLVVVAAPGVPLPAPMAAGDRIDPAAQDFETRSALDVGYNGRTLPWDKSYAVHLVRVAGTDTPGSAYDLNVTTLPLPASRELGVLQGSFVIIIAILAALGLLLIWRGRDLPAAALAGWCFFFIVGITFNYLPYDGVLGIGFLLLGLVFFLLARVAFYLMADTLVAPLLGSRSLTLFRAAFALVLMLGAWQSLGSALQLGWQGDAELALPRYTLFFSWVFVVPVVLLLAGYRLAVPGLKAKLGWVAFAGVLLVVSVTITNAQPFGFLGSYVTSIIPFLVMATSLTYALLHLRVVSLAIVFDRALVYGLVTTLVVGVVAAVNSAVLRETLPPGAGLALQVLVPLSLGIVLGRVREILDRLVERVFFRSKYLAEKALRAFARRAGHFDDVSSLLQGTVTELRRQTGSTDVAIYSVEQGHCARITLTGETRFPAKLPTDDAVLVALRAEHRAVDLAPLASRLGEDGCVFPMLVLGNLRGLMVLKNRPGEHFGTDEMKLLTHLAREVGAAWRILRARENEALVRALADGELKTLKSARDRARAMTLAWSAS